MLKPMFGRRPKPKKFDLPLRYYDPKEDEKNKDRIRFQSKTRRPDRQGTKVMLYAGLLLFIVWIISIL
ncbi:MAG: hypothetical protein WEC12_06735 [Balneolaceae bacterium]